MSDDDDIPILIEQTNPANPPELSNKRVPLTIICGFLGAGKSTLLKRILTERHGYRIAVIMNEFGDTADIESRAINVSSAPDSTSASQTSEEFLELANGCLCCSLKDAGAAAIEKLMERKGAFDHILLETTGLADPGPIASTFWQNEEYGAGLGNDIVLDGVVCVVDAVFGKQQMEEDRAVDNIGESLRQIAGSDVIILNKTDLVSQNAAAEIELILRGVNPSATVHRAVRCDVDLGCIMGIKAFSDARQLQTVASASSMSPQGTEHDHQHEHSDSCADGSCQRSHITHYEMRGISSIKIDTPVMTSTQLDALDVWLRSVLWEGSLPSSTSSPIRSSDCGDNSSSSFTSSSKVLEILRCKGIFSTTSGSRYLLQGVRSLYELSQIFPSSGETDGVGDPESGKLVLIGKGLGEDVRSSLLKVLF